MDGATKGSLEDETFSADSATIVFRGANTHPGYAHKNGMTQAAGVFLGSYHALSGRQNRPKAKLVSFIRMRYREG